MAGPTELWRYQGGGLNSNDVLYAGSAAAYSSVFLTGSSSGNWGSTLVGDIDFSAAKLDSNGTSLWIWQEGSPEKDRMDGAAAVSDGGVVLTGYSSGPWGGISSSGTTDFAAVKLDAAGNVSWRWKAGTTLEDFLGPCVETTDGNVVIAGDSQGSVNGTNNDGTRDIVAVKLDVITGKEIWIYQAGNSDTANVNANVAAARADGSVVLAGSTHGTFADKLSTTDGDTDFAAVAIDANGEELWRWQDGPDHGTNIIYSCTALLDGSVVLAGTTGGDWDGVNKGDHDFAMVKLDESGFEEWRWQDGTEFYDKWEAAATAIDGSIVVAGTTYGNWTGKKRILGDDQRDFAAMAIDEEGMLLWSYQDGTNGSDEFQAISVRPDGAILLAGTTDGEWTTSENNTYGDDYAAVLINGSVFNILSAESTISPTASPSKGPTTALIPYPRATAMPVADVTHIPSPLAPIPANSIGTGTHWPSSTPAEDVPHVPFTVAPTPANLNGTGTSWPDYVEPLPTSSSGTSLGLIVGCIACGAAVGVMLGVLVNRASRLHRRGLNTGIVMPLPRVGRHFPSAAPSLNDASHSVPSRHFPAAVPPLDEPTTPSPTVF